MLSLDVTALDYRTVNERLRRIENGCTLTGCCGQRYIAAAMQDKSITIEGIPGNALGAYLNGASITVHGNAQDAVGDTMNDGKIVVHGNIGDAAGYAMRGGKLFVKGNAGYRAGIHMKAYSEKVPLLIIGGTAGSFLGEYQAGGVIIVLGLDTESAPTTKTINESEKKIVGYFPCTGMHGGKLFLRSDCRNIIFPDQVTAQPATAEDIAELRGYLAEYCDLFGYDIETILNTPFTVVTPDSKNPYQQLYVAN